MAVKKNATTEEAKKPKNIVQVNKLHKDDAVAKTLTSPEMFYKL